MSHGDLEDTEGAEKWVRENARAFRQFCDKNRTKYPDITPRRFLRLWLERCYKAWGWPFQVLGLRAVVIFHEEMNSNETTKN